MKREKTKKGEESVWDYPRPPKLEQVNQPLKVVFNGEVVAATQKAFRMLETSHPPVYYFPQEDIQWGFFKENEHRTYCEFKGTAAYFDLVVADRQSQTAAWTYKTSKTFPQIENYVAFYASKVDACYVGNEKVMAQEGDFYGGWITSKIKGPFKGGKGTWGW